MESYMLLAYLEYERLCEAEEPRVVPLPYAEWSATIEAFGLRQVWAYPHYNS